ncbi:outer membrane beta-barrel protein [Chitinophaga tropicalis]|uniref:Outer membrane beta-barrel protein n=1 Tax=Chitinophaga tropicalis TaxID=2683588 RepID=A0A7K1UA11_9BACT|nr:outer membrane beta-barrel protein [Chitinophaga tropicalis]MVT11183.1 outer membrane beta-barrel protein [Chitinophaga tropicalis]
MRSFTTGCAILFIILSISQAFSQTRDTLKVRALKEVIVESKPPVRMKGDTVEYDASRFKTRENAVVEELLRKLPGVKVDKGGNIIAQGEKVSKVLVDGKEFFGNDPSIATKNLPADMVSKIQVLDKMSDQEEFTGIDDGNKTKTINIITKKDRKKGYFGNISAGAGSNGRYEAGLNINSFIGEQQVSLLFKANNVNKTGFSASELIKMLSNNPEMFNNLPSFAISELSKMKGVQINTDDPAEKAELSRAKGLNNTQYGGVNYNNNRGDDLKLRSNYFYNRFTTQNNFDYARHYQLPDTAYNYLQRGRTSQENINHRANGSLDIRLNSNYSLKVSPVFLYNTTENTSNREYSSSATDGKLLNRGSQELTGNSKSTNASTDILYRHRFGRAGRTLSVTLTPGYFKMDNLSLNYSKNRYYNIGQDEVRDSIDQQTKGISENYTVNSTIIYTEQLSSHLALKLTERLDINRGNYRQLANNFNHASARYDLEDERYSDIYSGNTFKALTDVAFAGKYKRFNYTAGIGFESSKLNTRSGYKGYEIDGRYHNLLPHVYARYRFSKSRNLSLYYNTQSTLPGFGQLRPLEDITDPLYTRRGNPDLKQAVNHSITLAYLLADVYRNTFTNIQLRLSTVRNQFTDQYSVDNSGRQVILPINANGNFMGSLHAERSVPVDDNGASLTIGAEISYNQYPGYFNAVADKIRLWGVTPDFNFNYYIGNVLNITARGSTAWNKRQSEALLQEYWFLNYGLDAIVSLPLKISVNAGVDCYTTTGLSSAYNNTVSLLNAGITKDIGKRYALQMEVQDLLNQNNSFSRLSRNGYTEDRRNNVLGRYYMLTLICKLRHFAKSSK